MTTHAVLCVGRKAWAIALFFLLTLNCSPAQPAVVINEIGADNRFAFELAGDYPDWLELRNTTPNDVDLSDWSLTDAPLLPRRFVFPRGTVVPANGFLVVYCD